MAASASEEEVVKVIHHVFLPPQLPQEEDTSSEIIILNIATEALKEFRTCVALDAPPVEIENAINSAITLLSNVKAVHKGPNGGVSKDGLLHTLVDLQDGQTMAIKVAAQNAGVLITRKKAQLIFEQFELSPQNEDIIRTKGRLVRTFPALAVAVDVAQLQQAGFADMIAKTLWTMSHQAVPGMQPQAKKAGAKHDEHRDSTRPAIVSELFFGLLRGIGSSQSTSSVSKNTREEVLWNYAGRPWRRSPMWLLIRVTLQLVTSRATGGSNLLYKEMMAFIMSHILDAAVKFSMPAELLYVINAKIDRRRQKLLAAEPLHPSIGVDIGRVLQKSNENISMRWRAVREEDRRKIDICALKDLNFEEDSHVYLPGLDTYIQAMKSRQNSDSVTAFMPSTGLLKPGTDNIPPLPHSSTDTYAASNLQQFEEWVAQDLDWTSLGPGDPCEKLCSLIKKYHSIARLLYADNPEGTSTMLLTILELWVACDQAAVESCSFLADYNPGISSKVLQSLLLPSLGQMERLSTIESYLTKRKGRPGLSKLFDTNSCQSFASRFYDTSAEHQALRKRIESQAKVDQEAKLNELERTQSQYRYLDDSFNATDCEYETKTRYHPLYPCGPPETVTEHKYDCKKCEHRMRRDKLSITIYEWPLPENDTNAKAVVFELDIPRWFSHWRNATFYLLHAVLQGKLKRKPIGKSYSLSSNDPHLTKEYFDSVRHRIDLVSETKPMVASHYCIKNIAHCDESTVCVRNGLRYRYYDSTAQSWVDDFIFDDSVPQACMYKLPARSKTLQQFLFRPASNPDGQAPNAVIASQDTCPISMALEEYKELCTLPLGRHIQWTNINLQLAMPSVDFKKPETTLFFLQCIYQAGPPSANNKSLRQAHSVFHDDAMAFSLVENLQVALQRLKGNWESAQALSTFVAIATRVFSLNDAAKDACLVFLKASRSVAADWMKALCDRAYTAKVHADRTEFVSRSIEVALICASTFDIDDKYLEMALQSAEDVSLLVQASIVVQEGGQAQAIEKSPHIALLDLRFRRLLSRCYQLLMKNEAGLDAAIMANWSAYIPGAAGWAQVSTAADHWITTTTATAAGGNAMHVHYNLLSGEFLVNGVPLYQPPANYRNQPLFKALFGEAPVEIMPATSPGFQFSTKRSFEGFAVQLGMNRQRLIVQTTDSSGTFETVPSSTLRDSYPSHFLNDYVLWYDAANNFIEFRPIADPWNPESALKWTLSKDGAAGYWRLAKDGAFLLGVGRQTAQTLGRIFHPLTDSTAVHCMLQPTGGLQVEIPLLRLGFSLAKMSSNLQSREYPSMIVDRDQTLGTLIGFSNKLVLKSHTSNNRLALILESSLTFCKQGDHVSVEIEDRSKSKAHAVEVDWSLHRFQDNGDLDCKLYLAYLHALTSFCLPDPLTLRTGTEEALTILRSKAVESFHQLSQANVDLLGKIANLSPGRCYYPDYERVMQQVDWDKNLGFLAQHGDFSVIASALWQQSKTVEIFFPGTHLQAPHWKSIQEDLRTRDSIRSSAFRVSGFGAEDHITTEDEFYVARDQGYMSKEAQNVAIMSRLFLRGGDTTHWATPSSEYLWNLMQTQSLVHGPGLQIEASHIRYDANLLQSGFRSAAAKLLPLHHWLKNQRDSPESIFDITAWLCTMAFVKDADMTVLQVLVMCFKSPLLVGIDAPSVESFTPKYGRTCDEQELRNIIFKHRRKHETCPEYKWPIKKNERAADYDYRRKSAWQSSSDDMIKKVAKAITTQWPCQVPTDPVVADASTYINMNDAMKAVETSFQAWYANRLLHRYLDAVQREMKRLSSQPISLPDLNHPQPPIASPTLPGFVSEDDLFSEPAPELPPAPKLPPAPALLYDCRSLELTSSDHGQTRRNGESPLQPLIQKLCSIANHSTYERKYVQDLEGSLEALISESDRDTPAIPPARDALATHLEKCKVYVEEVYDLLVTAMRGSSRSKAAREVQRMPRISPTFLLKQLTRDRWSSLSEEWQTCIVTYGMALTALHRVERLSKLAEASRPEDLISELRNAGHENWKPRDHPEWLLVEVESRLMIRKVQAQIAREMLKPDSGSNAVMQLNMGEGKSSVIIPIVTTALANGSQLARVVVAKPQSKQMAQMLISKLGGLVNRRVYYMPFSRSLKLTRSAAKTVSNMLHECMATGGILLVQPEHILSHKLMALECYVSENEDVGRSVVSTQDFLDRSCRDVVDESDEIFSTRFELIYTIGTQQSIERSPDRWLLVQQVLRIVKEIAPDIAVKLPDFIELTPGVAGSFPRLRILDPDAEELVIALIATYVCHHGLDGFRLDKQYTNVRDAVYTYITKSELSADEINTVEKSPMWTGTSQSHVLMLRGLLAQGVLAFTLGRKRWRVDYGLAARTPPTKLAVPYRAKDSPSPRSEFSHPDVVITLTSLCYYYEGLSDEDLFTALGHLMKSDQAEDEYKAWVDDCPDDLATAFEYLQGINLKDRLQCTTELFPKLRYGKSVVDYFLSHIVFPKEMKEFPHKLSASGWDIGKPRERLTTGFSGTIDSRHVLPLGVSHVDLPEQRHTNALVLNHLLQPETGENGVHLLESAVGATSKANHLLRSIVQLSPPVQVILDVGAQILELNNFDMAKAWLQSHNRSKEAVVFVDDCDEICVVDRKGRVDLLRTSSYQSRLDSCLIFLDEAHTRGIDLKLPVYYRAAVTLGANLTKDRLVQACMRMRQLGKGQTIVFLISKEMETKILKTNSKPSDADIEVADILAWSVSETHSEIRRSVPLWAVQGERFVRQEKLWKAAESSNGKITLTKDLAVAFQENEAQTIKDRYRPRQIQNQPTLHVDTDHGAIASRCREFDGLHVNSSTLQEEQERELSPEIEQERQIQRALPAAPTGHRLHPDVEKFAMTGELVEDSNAYRPAFGSLKHSSAEKVFPAGVLLGDQHLLATTEFAETVKINTNGSCSTLAPKVQERPTRRGGRDIKTKVVSFVSDTFLRPVQWVLTCRARGSDQVEYIMIISAYEANQLYGRMKYSSATALHVYKPRVNSGYASLDNLDFHIIPNQSTTPRVPPVLLVQLNLFAGQLYISSFREYQDICHFLGLLPREFTKDMEEQGWKIDTDGFILSDDQGQIGGESRLTKSPVGFFKALMSIRRNGDGIAKTHIGKLLSGKVFKPSDFARTDKVESQEGKPF